MCPRSRHSHLIDYAIVRQADLKDVLLTRAMRRADWTDHRTILKKVRSLRCQCGSKKKPPHLARLSNNDTWNNLSHPLPDKLADIEQLINSEICEWKWMRSRPLSTTLFDTTVHSIGKISGLVWWECRRNLNPPGQHAQGKESNPWRNSGVTSALGPKQLYGSC